MQVYLKTLSIVDNCQLLKLFNKNTEIFQIGFVVENKLFCDTCQISTFSFILVVMDDDDDESCLLDLIG